MTSISGRSSRRTWDLYKDANLKDRREKVVLNHYAEMFLQDLSHQRYAYDWRLDIGGVEPRAARSYLSYFLSELSVYQWNDGDALFWELFDRIVRELVENGFCVGEVFWEGAEGQQGLNVVQAECRFDVLPGWSLKRRPLTWTQVDISERLGRRRLQQAQLLQISAPKRLITRVNSSLQDLSLIYPEGLVGGFERFLGSQVYDFKFHKRSLDEMGARASAPLGWKGRGLFTERATDSYSLYRELRFIGVWLQFLEVATEAINHALIRAVADSGGFSVRVVGLPSLRDVEAGMAAVRDGTESLDAIRRRLVHPKFA